MKQKLHLTASFENPTVLESMVEQLATKHNEANYVQVVAPHSWQAMESSTVESYVNGTIDISGKGFLPIHLPFTSSFLFGCTREKNLPYHVRWTMSLS